MKNRYIHPAVIRLENESYIVNFPDFNNCFTFGDSLEDALDSARDVLELTLYDMEKDNIILPVATNINDIRLKKKDSIAMI